MLSIFLIGFRLLVQWMDKQKVNCRWVVKLVDTRDCTFVIFFSILFLDLFSFLDLYGDIQIKLVIRTINVYDIKL